MWSCKSIRSVNQVQITFMELLYHCWKKRQKFSSQHITKHLLSWDGAFVERPALIQEEAKWLKENSRAPSSNTWMDTKSQEIGSAKRDLFGLCAENRTCLQWKSHTTHTFLKTTFGSSESPFWSIVSLAEIQVTVSVDFLLVDLVSGI